MEEDSASDGAENEEAIAELRRHIAELEAKSAEEKKLEERKRQVAGIYAVGARVETREEASGEWEERWSEPSSVGEVVLVRCSPPELATYDVRYGDGRVAEAVPLERIRRPCTKVIAPDGRPYASPLEHAQDLIIQASCVGDVDTVRRCLDAGAKLDRAMNGWYESIIFTASGRGHTDLVRLLIERGAAVDEPHHGSAQGKRNWRPLHYALFHGYHETARLLIEHGARVDGGMLNITVHSPDDHRLHIDERDCHIPIVSPLFLACRAAADEDMEDYDIDENFTGWEEDRDQSGADGAACVRLLLEHVDVDWNMAGYFCWTQLHIACLAGRTGVAKVLLAHGADPFRADLRGMTPLDAARGLRTDRSAYLDPFDTEKYETGHHGVPVAGQARREKAALNEMFDRYLTAHWKRTFDLTFARLPDHAIAGDEYLARHLGSFVIGEILPRKKEDVPDAGDASSVASDAS